MSKGISQEKASKNVMSAEEKDLLKGKHETFKTGLKAKIAKRKEENLKKLNKIKIKTKRI